MVRIEGLSMHMLASLFLAISQAAAPAGLAGNQPIPGPFHPLILNGELAGRYHCPLSDFGPRPFVLVLIRGTDAPEGLKEMLGELNDLVEKSKAAALRSAVIFVEDKLETPLYLANAERKAARDKIDAALGFASDPKMEAKNPFPGVYVGLDSAEVLKTYPLGEGTAAVAVLARDYKVLAVEKVAEGQFNAEKWKTILSNADSKLVDKTLAPVVRPRLKPRAPVAEAPPAQQ